MTVKIKKVQLTNKMNTKGISGLEDNSNPGSITHMCGSVSVSVCMSLKREIKRLILGEDHILQTS